MKHFPLGLCLFLGLIASASGQYATTDEDRSRFVERLYQKPEPGFRTPDEYIAIAKKTAHSQIGSEITFTSFSDGVVTRRTYRNAPAADREMICVAFVYRGQLSGGGMIGPGFIYSREAPARPILLVLMRRDLSKIYVNVAHFKR